MFAFFFFQAEDGIRDDLVTGVQTCALPISVFHALKTMQEQDISQIPVFEENFPIGTIYEDQILTLALQGKDLRKLVVREVMSKPLPQVPKTAPVERVTHILSHENPSVFVVMGNAHFDILTKYDLMSTVA